MHPLARAPFSRFAKWTEHAAATHSVGPRGGQIGVWLFIGLLIGFSHTLQLVRSTQEPGSSRS